MITEALSRYIVFDVETPNRYNNRMSAIVITVIENDTVRSDKTEVYVDGVFDSGLRRYS